MSKQKLRIISLDKALEYDNTSDINNIIEVAEKIYSYLTKDGVDSESDDAGGWSHQSSRKVFP